VNAESIAYLKFFAAAPNEQQIVESGLEHTQIVESGLEPTQIIEWSQAHTDCWEWSRAHTDCWEWSRAHTDCWVVLSPHRLLRVVSSPLSTTLELSTLTLLRVVSSPLSTTLELTMLTITPPIWLGIYMNYRLFYNQSINTTVTWGIRCFTVLISPRNENLHSLIQIKFLNLFYTFI
jgi:hypothetical protein